jgi:hypothetical protein
VSDLEQELRAALSDPPVELDTRRYSPVAELHRRLDVRARRRSIAMRTAAVVVVFSAGVIGIRALPSSTDAGSNGAGGGQALAPRTNDGAAQPVAGVPPEVLAAARRALTLVVDGKPAGVLRWARDGADYRVQIPLVTTTTCKVCRDPGAIPQTGAVIELRVPAGAPDAAADPTVPGPAPSAGATSPGSPGQPPASRPAGAPPLEGYRLLTVDRATDFGKIPGARQAPFTG